eukprot:CAMPEP_0167828126 /NCGR_PEP_ID=MMETSP0112_2-20121227/11190_1 /TAXON_ID=91324 /ORGANISM="Lotharella globosa, Strain CCCM811" /LENGTH=65 /DNA_ID=CAMNT_0007731193 /DNA_START=393 /DNA_END=588 /DNA_ORIENTATION=-
MVANNGDSPLGAENGEKVDVAIESEKAGEAERRARASERTCACIEQGWRNGTPWHFEKGVCELEK